MERISLYEKKDNGYIKVSNCFVDFFLKEANEAQIKVYLYLLRSVSSGADISVPDIADRFNYTERDIIRSLIYWDKKGLISLDFDEDRNVKGICLNPAEKPLLQPSQQPSQGSVSPVSGAKPARDIPRPFYSSGQIQDFRENSDVRGLLFAAEQYLGRPLSSSDLNSILYIYDGLHFDTDLIEYLVEYCVSSGHRNMHYIEAVALDWHEKGILTIEDAKLENDGHKDCYEVLKAFGISGRNPVKSEIDYIRRWKDEYGFSSELIIEAVNRTMSSISKPSFRYADSILRRWKIKNVTSVSDLEAEDRLFEADKKDDAPRTNVYHNFKERDYDFSELEKKFARN